MDEELEEEDSEEAHRSVRRVEAADWRNVDEGVGERGAIVHV